MRTERQRKGWSEQTTTHGHGGGRAKRLGKQRYNDTRLDAGRDDAHWIVADSRSFSSSSGILSKFTNLRIFTLCSATTSYPARPKLFHILRLLMSTGTHSTMQTPSFHLLGCFEQLTLLSYSKALSNTWKTIGLHPLLPHRFTMKFWSALISAAPALRPLAQYWTLSHPSQQTIPLSRSSIQRIRHTTGSMAVGVAVADSITGPYRDALGKPLVENNEIDPTVWIDDDGQAYLYCGLPIKFTLTTQGFGTRTGNAQRPTTFEEGPWIYKRNGLYYLVYAADCCSEDIRYSTALDYRTLDLSWCYHGYRWSQLYQPPRCIVEYRGHSYSFYHNGALLGGSGYTRSVCVEQSSYNIDSSIPTISMTTNGPPKSVP
ncbi:hypothetical protein D9619_003607 [Psilocybe cf. subviscida]|uniref:Glycoside hydrolase family 43 protein n=1 Tax=Psilocybe cf. subviscida TaxID=2480587 RepID=A0A8H5AW28_9AGAR|nr:hypothetical protein D9619_003607 [Psilocybe cf. subviscida]